MKKTFLIILFLAVLTLSGKSQMKFQPANDTIVFIIDTLQPFVKYGFDSLSIKTNPANQIPWLITVQCHYFDTTYPAEKESAKITFSQKFELIKGKFSPNTCKFKWKDLAGKYLFVPDYWIQKQLDYDYLSLRLGLRYIDKNYYYVVFKNELDNPQCDSVNMYAVGIGWCEIIE